MCQFRDLEKAGKSNEEVLSSVPASSVIQILQVYPFFCFFAPPPSKRCNDETSSSLTQKENEQLDTHIYTHRERERLVSKVLIASIIQTPTPSVLQGSLCISASRSPFPMIFLCSFHPRISSPRTPPLSPISNRYEQNKQARMQNRTRKVHQ
jgi:hypothetical protein